MASSPLQEAVLKRLERVTGPAANGWYNATCPFHEDTQHPKPADQDGGFKCMRCQARLSPELARKLGLDIATSQPKRSIEKTYDYQDSSGQLLFQVVRYEPKGSASDSPTATEAGSGISRHRARPLSSAPGSRC